MKRKLAIVAAVAALGGAASAYAVATAGGPGNIFGAAMIRAEVVEVDGSVFDLYRGRLVQVNQAGLTIREPDGRTDNVPLDASTRVAGAVATTYALRRGMRATIVRRSNGPALYVLVGR